MRKLKASEMLLALWLKQEANYWNSWWKNLAGSELENSGNSILIGLDTSDPDIRDPLGNLWLILGESGCDSKWSSSRRGTQVIAGLLLSFTTHKLVILGTTRSFMNWSEVPKAKSSRFGSVLIDDLNRDGSTPDVPTQENPARGICRIRCRRFRTGEPVQGFSR